MNVIYTLGGGHTCVHTTRKKYSIKARHVPDLIIALDLAITMVADIQPLHDKSHSTEHSLIGTHSIV